MSDGLNGRLSSSAKRAQRFRREIRRRLAEMPKEDADRMAELLRAQGKTWEAEQLERLREETRRRETDEP